MQRKGGGGRVGEIFHSQMNTIAGIGARGGPAQNQESRTPSGSLTWVLLGPPSTGAPIFLCFSLYISKGIELVKLKPVLLWDAVNHDRASLTPVSKHQPLKDHSKFVPIIPAIGHPEPNGHQLLLPLPCSPEAMSLCFRTPWV